VAEANVILGHKEYNRLREVCCAIHMSYDGVHGGNNDNDKDDNNNNITIENKTHYDRKFSDHKDQGNHPLQLIKRSVQQQQQQQQ
jgi:hypothetical protein